MKESFISRETIKSRCCCCVVMYGMVWFGLVLCVMWYIGWIARFSVPFHDYIFFVFCFFSFFFSSFSLFQIYFIRSLTVCCILGDISRTVEIFIADALMHANLYKNTISEGKKRSKNS